MTGSQKVQAPRISRKLAHEGGKVSPMHRLPLPAQEISPSKAISSPQFFHLKSYTHFSCSMYIAFLIYFILPDYDTFQRVQIFEVLIMRFSPVNHYPFHEDLNILLRSLSSDTYIFHFSFRVRDQSTPVQYNRSVKLDFINEKEKQTEW